MKYQIYGYQIYSQKSARHSIKWQYSRFYKADILHEMSMKSDLHLKVSSSLTYNIRFIILKLMMKSHLATDMKDHEMKYQDLGLSDV